jgi:DNA-binding transcriptional LysR family regulator
MRSPSRRDISLTQLTYFVEAAEHGSMTAAADELRVAQSAVSTSVANLEQSLGVQLLIRRRAKGLQLTAAGSELLARARVILAGVDDALDALRPDSLSGRISVGCFRTLAPFYLPSILRGLGEEHPELRVDVTELTVEQVSCSLLDHSIEIALTYRLGFGPEIRCDTLASVPMYAAVSREHPLAARETVSLSELVDEPMVLLDLPVSRDYFLRAFTDHGLRPSVRYRFGNYEAVRAMVATGHGFTLLNQQPRVGYTYSGSQLHHLRIEEPTAALDLVLAWADGFEVPTRKAELFAEQCRRSVADLDHVSHV